MIATHVNHQKHKLIKIVGHVVLTENYFSLLTLPEIVYKIIPSNFLIHSIAARGERIVSNHSNNKKIMSLYPDFLAAHQPS